MSRRHLFLLSAFSILFLQSSNAKGASCSDLFITGSHRIVSRDGISVVMQTFNPAVNRLSKSLESFERTELREPHLRIDEALIADIRSQFKTLGENIVWAAQLQHSLNMNSRRLNTVLIIQMFNFKDLRADAERKLPGFTFTDLDADLRVAQEQIISEPR